MRRSSPHGSGGKPAPPTNKSNKGNIDPSLKCKCTRNNNLIVNEILTFINDKIGTLSETAIVDICMSAYNIEEIEDAKQLVYDLLNPQKKSQRRQEGGERRSLQDIIRCIKNCNEDGLPIFVAQKLNKLPAVTFDRIDMSAFIKDMISYKSKVEKLMKKDEEGSLALGPDIRALQAEIKTLNITVDELQTKVEIQNVTCRKLNQHLRSCLDHKNTRGRSDKELKEINKATTLMSAMSVASSKEVDPQADIFLNSYPEGRSESAVNPVILNPANSKRESYASAAAGPRNGGSQRVQKESKVEKHGEKWTKVKYTKKKIANRSGKAQPAELKPAALKYVPYIKEKTSNNVSDDDTQSNYQQSRLSSIPLSSWLRVEK